MRECPTIESITKIGIYPHTEAGCVLRMAMRISIGIVKDFTIEAVAFSVDYARFF
jgi:hypothetical protein